ncbi:unnamed protein product [Phaedon cochleariae]|uniref:Uncharacterized protein n=1 Tax=Phaedon cochleariae TaxID=80249 RepID=A0A9N9X8C3_PHACE|nr:unnamed protein product [Phaedon cochleariae]
MLLVDELKEVCNQKSHYINKLKEEHDIFLEEALNMERELLDTINEKNQFISTLQNEKKTSQRELKLNKQSTTHTDAQENDTLMVENSNYEDRNSTSLFEEMEVANNTTEANERNDASTHFEDVDNIYQINTTRERNLIYETEAANITSEANERDNSIEEEDNTNQNLTKSHRKMYICGDQYAVGFPRAVTKIIDQSKYKINSNIRPNVELYEENAGAEADSDVEDQLKALDTESASSSVRNTSSPAPSTISIFTNSPVTADYDLDRTLADETLAEAVPGSQACGYTDHKSFIRYSQ